MVTDYVYDTLNRLDKLTHFAPDATPDDLSDNSKLAEFDYAVRADGRRTHVVERLWRDGGSQPPVTNTIDWTYDDIGRLIAEAFDASDNSLDYTDGYTFDLTGNRRGKTHDAGRDGTVDDTTSYSYLWKEQPRGLEFLKVLVS